jgi:hypothetical protein
MQRSQPSKLRAMLGGNELPAYQPSDSSVQFVPQMRHCDARDDAQAAIEARLLRESNKAARTKAMPVGWVLATTGTAGGVRSLAALDGLPLEPDGIGLAYPFDDLPPVKGFTRQRDIRDRLLLAFLNRPTAEHLIFEETLIPRIARKFARAFSLDDEQSKELADQTWHLCFRVQMAVNSAVGGEARRCAGRLAKQSVRPPTSSPNNIEVGVMSALHFLCTAFGDDAWTAFRVRSAYVDAAEDAALRSTMLHAWQQTELLRKLRVSKEWRRGWYEHGFPKVEVGHKLSASLCLTDVPDDLEVKAPWPAWSLVLPDGLLGDYARVWCLGSEVHCVLSKGDPSRSPEVGGTSPIDSELLRNLVRGVCLAMSEPKDFEKKSSGAASKTKRHIGTPAFDQARYILSAPVTVDLRQQLADVRNAPNSKTGGPPKVQFLVRGHWRRQACGSSRLDRKVIWIKPFWKGPEHGRILLRNHTVREDDPHPP